MRLQTIRAADARRTGFTLIELLVSIAIIMILAGITLAVVLTAQARARRLNCLSNLNQIAAGLFQYANGWNWAFPANQPYVPPGVRPANPTHGDDDLSALYTSHILADLGVFNCPSTTDHARDDPTALPPRMNGEDIKFKRSDKDAKGNPRGTQLSYEYLGEYNPSPRYGSIKPQVAVLAHDDDGLDYVSTIAGGVYVDQVSNFVTSGRDNHRGAGGNVLFLDGHIEWIVPTNWKQRLVDAIKEWYRVTGWHLRGADRS